MLYNSYSKIIDGHILMNIKMNRMLLWQYISLHITSKSAEKKSFKEDIGNDLIKYDAKCILTKQ